MLVKELIDILRYYPQDMKVVGTWEGIVRDIFNDRVYTGSIWVNEDVVFIDVDIFCEDEKMELGINEKYMHPNFIAERDCCED